MKKLFIYALIISLLLTFCACKGENSEKINTTENSVVSQGETDDGITDIILSDDKILVENNEISMDSSEVIYKANDIVYYENSKDFTYGEGEEGDAHTKEEADAHTVIHITEEGIYRLSGTLSKGQVAVDLGDDAKDNPDAVVTLILDNTQITCQVAPAVIFYNVYECGNTDTETAKKDVDTQSAGANVIIADNSENTISGSYVAKIYKPETVVLNDDGTEVEDAKKLHKYDGAVYSKMSMNLFGGEKGNGILNINAENEGMGSELHLTVNGGIINIKSGNDGINTNEDGVSVTTVNGGELNIIVTGETGEGDGIDSNGWLVINGGTVQAQACADSADAGIDSDMGIHINAGKVIASGNMLDRIEEGSQKYILFNLREELSEETTLNIMNADKETIDEFTLKNNCSLIIYSSDKLTEDKYTLYIGDKEISANNIMQGMVGMRPERGEGMEPPEGFGDSQRPAPPDGFGGMERPSHPEGMEPPEGFDGSQRPTPPEGFEGMTPPAIPQ